MKPNNLREVFVREAVKHDQKSDKEIWLSAVFCESVVGNYDRGATLGLADDMNRSTDTIEDRAHAYELFKRLCKMDSGEFRLFVFQARRAPYIHYSHFRALYDLQKSFNLHDADVLSLLQDIVQAEGDLSSRKLEEHIRKKFGKSHPWTYFAAKALKALNQTEGQPDLPNIAEVIGSLYAIAFDVDGETFRFYVLADRPPRAEAIARKQLAILLEIETEDTKEYDCTENTVMDKILTDSKNILGIASSWLGDNA